MGKMEMPSSEWELAPSLHLPGKEVQLQGNIYFRQYGNGGDHLVVTATFRMRTAPCKRWHECGLHLQGALPCSSSMLVHSSDAWAIGRFWATSSSITWVSALGSWGTASLAFI